MWCTLGPEQPGGGWVKPQGKPDQVQTSDRRLVKAKTNKLEKGPGHLASSLAGWEVMKYILVTGGVISGIGKGVIASSFGTILKCCNIDVTSIKIDPYINIDAGTFSPYEHGMNSFNLYLLIFQY
uniref:CTP synthase N-terminal domain-containing protein n=1 Tax=Timema douglasi TaxID=61478 RepID=A0A7R8VS91_TIMDO|nr:unnamed protein product [Timema douglasi]